MQIIILAGGLATRLRPVTEKIPKAMLEIHGRPFLEHQFELLKKNGITDIILALWYRGDQIEKYFGDGQKFGVNIQYSYDGDKPLDTAGAIKKAGPLLKGPFLVMNGDSYLPIDYQAVVNYFLNKTSKKGLMTVYKNAGQWDHSNVAVADDLIVAYTKDRTVTGLEYIDYGLSAFRPEVLDLIPANEPYSLTQVYEKLIQDKELSAYEVFERFYENGSFEGMQDLEKYLATIDKVRSQR